MWHLSHTRGRVQQVEGINQDQQIREQREPQARGDTPRDLEDQARTRRSATDIYDFARDNWGMKPTVESAGGESEQRQPNTIPIGKTQMARPASAWLPPN